MLIAVAWLGLSRFARLWTPYIALWRFADPASQVRAVAAEVAATTSGRLANVAVDGLVRE